MGDANNVVAPLAWTADEPKATGYYWLKVRGESSPGVARVVLDAHGANVGFAGSDEWDRLGNPLDAPHYAGALWCGPLVPPEGVPDGR